MALTKEQAATLENLEALFQNRYSSEDNEYNLQLNDEDLIPPIVYNLDNPANANRKFNDRRGGDGERYGGAGDRWDRRGNDYNHRRDSNWRGGDRGSWQNNKRRRYDDDRNDRGSRERYGKYDDDSNDRGSRDRYGKSDNRKY